MKSERCEMEIIMRNRVFKINYNPYRKEIGYQVKEEGENWEELGDKSKLIRDSKFSANIILQHCAMEILKEIEDQYHPREIIFEGTEEDYQDLKSVIDNFYGEKIRCRKGDYYIESAQNLLLEIEEKFRQLDKTFKNYESPEISDIIGEFKDVTQEDIPIFVMGTYSAGKSAFINAMIGAEILPSKIDTTTAKVYEIMESKCADQGEVKFSNNGKEIKVKFDKNKEYSVSEDIDEDLKVMLTQSLEKNSGGTVTSQLFYCISAVNSYAEENPQKVGDIIEVQTPFNSLLKSDKKTFVFYDSPGSNSARNKEHLKILKGTLKSRTNGLPIILTVPKNTESNDVEKLRQMLKELHNLDMTNAMLIVNQADSGIGAEDLKRLTNNNRILSKWKLNRAYFLSAIIGLASKLENIEKNGWQNETYATPYEETKAKFTGDDFKLYQYNIMSQNRKEEYQGIADSFCAAYDPRKAMYVNSGLHCIESEILNFAQKQALYHKCRRARGILKTAIKHTERKVDENKKKIHSILETQKQEKERFRGELTQRLNDKIDTFRDESAGRYPGHMEDLAGELRTEAKGNIKQIVAQGIEATKSIKKNKVDEFIKIVEPEYSSILEEVENQIFLKSEDYWYKQSDSLKRQCCKIVKENQEMIEKDKQILEHYIMNLSNPIKKEKSIDIKRENIVKSIFNMKLFPLRKVLSSIKRDPLKKVLSVLFRDEVDEALAYDKIYEEVKDRIRKFNGEIIDLHRDEFDGWKEELKNGLDSRLGDMNPILQKFTIEIQKLEGKIEQLETQRERLNNEQLELNNLMEVRK